MKNLLLLIAVLALAVVPLMIHRPGAGATDTAASSALFTGSDDQAKGMISKINPEYKPWFAPFWAPPSSEIEGLLFTLQAVIGSGALFYFLGYIRGRNSAARKTDGKNAPS